MIQLNPKIDNYIADGCGRCKYFATDLCKVRKWKVELENLRQIVLECNLIEELKWGVPVYTFDGKNVIILSALKDVCTLGFFKGVLLEDKSQLLIQQGENSQSSRIIKFTSLEEIQKLNNILKDYILEAIQIEKSGQKVAFKKDIGILPEELLEKFEELPEFKKAFFSLTPGRQRGYVLHFSQPKHSQTKTNRINKNINKILNGEGLNENYK